MKRHSAILSYMFIISLVVSVEMPLVAAKKISFTHTMEQKMKSFSTMISDYKNLYQKCRRNECSLEEKKELQNKTATIIAVGTGIFVLVTGSIATAAFVTHRRKQAKEAAHKSEDAHLQEQVRQEQEQIKTTAKEERRKKKQEAARIQAEQEKEAARLKVQQEEHRKQEQLRLEQEQQQVERKRIEEEQLRIEQEKKVAEQRAEQERVEQEQKQAAEEEERRQRFEENQRRIALEKLKQEANMLIGELADMPEIQTKLAVPMIKYNEAQNAFNQEKYQEAITAANETSNEIQKIRKEQREEKQRVLEQKQKEIERQQIEEEQRFEKLIKSAADLLTKLSATPEIINGNKEIMPKYNAAQKAFDQKEYLKTMTLANEAFIGINKIRADQAIHNLGNVIHPKGYYGKGIKERKMGGDVESAKLRHKEAEKLFKERKYQAALAKAKEGFQLLQPQP